MRHFLTFEDFSKDEIFEILRLAAEIKKEAKAKDYKPYLKNQTLAMIFEKSSTRTRVSFETGMYQLGGQALFLSSKDIQLGRGEPVRDTARVISSMVDMAMLRVYKQSDLEEFAKYSAVPVINGLSDYLHPVQLIADYLTMQERANGDCVAYIGDGNNMAHTWISLASILGFELRIATPKGYEADASIVAQAEKNAKISGAKIIYTHDPREAVCGVDVVTTDTWVSMGQESEKERKVKQFEGFCVDKDMMSLAKKDAIFLHCLPAYRGYEVSDEIIEAHAGDVFSEAENRLHGQKGVMVWLDRHRGN
ncbi:MULTISPECIES: ornithine carbamoyltransferase [unclassified Campylobacter]|uniref:ornithine carbamoyltransferase n=1 Tax=unclassified Campylobacter TaxID=2593542 RepID=UPI0022E9D751|nr:MULTISPECIES: ornithine carbamoyltransferase [unclassified Campylobacter]MDA3042800.1 ornithine carbamoyltransferase [Campylobacter sp. JMF_09 ED2]MDA3044365.1 ornithine carbamoyltransferase [Campylobacter sp. JMF_07 ED4]MDA3060985.1 ornithine carbamoyltransferase [Campylobacter sp. VBCF_02 NA5]MDA3063711.1 ornithine carbamoyltransferase [Campylobacter sp. JMF_11 EL3]MDA3070499.1 ornithine carbamoyltransferase [Campylobacter sp. VBCF_08 NA3]